MIYRYVPSHRFAELSQRESLYIASPQGEVAILKSCASNSTALREANVLSTERGIPPLNPNLFENEKLLFHFKESEAEGGDALYRYLVAEELSLAIKESDL